MLTFDYTLNLFFKASLFSTCNWKCTATIIDEDKNLETTRCEDIFKLKIEEG